LAFKVQSREDVIVGDDTMFVCTQKEVEHDALDENIHMKFTNHILRFMAFFFLPWSSEFGWHLTICSVYYATRIGNVENQSLFFCQSLIGILELLDLGFMF
jgi:hypothetical protein